MGRGGVFELRKSWGGGAQATFEIQVEEGVKKPCLPSGGGGGGGAWIFSGITH